ncbi:uncharacterized protein LOC141695732 [Apium graveolens]|uniref:uncharacterized protein LOC141695732 n=1 Tax=Apium graveolens TaxID=4045 RepID=UPI003D78B96E
MIKFPTPNGVGSLRGSQYESRDCYHKAVKEFCRRRYEGKGLPFEDTEDIQTKPSGEVYAHYFVEGPEEEETYATGAPILTKGIILRIRSVEEIVVNYMEEVVQKERRPVSGERAIELKEEVDRLLEVGLIKESFYPEWLANPVLVKKLNGKWRTCVNFTDLNKACQKDSFPLSRIDQLVDATAGHALLSFMDAYSGYNQIPICKEFFKAIKLAVKDFVWISKYEEAFKRIKEQLGNPPILSKQLDGESLILYLAVSEYSISVVLVREEDGQQSPVNYVSKRLHDAETRYTSMEKLVYALILASRKLRPYFQAYRIEVRTAYSLRQVLHKPESSGRMLKWAVKLGQFDLEYMPRTAIKGQALAHFLLEFDSVVDDKDGAVNNGGAGAGIVLVSPEGHHLMSAIHFKFYTTNNDVEHEALINGLKIALEMGVRNLIARSDSELEVNQVNGGFQAGGPRIELYLRCTQRLIEKFREVKLECVPREKNINADALAKMGSQQEVVLLGSIPLEIQEIPSIPEVEMMHVDEAPKETWMEPILAYIHKGILPKDKFKARRLRYQAARYVVYDEVLYKRGFNQPLLRCVDEEEGNYILREVHEGICGLGTLSSNSPSLCGEGAS